MLVPRLAATIALAGASRGAVLVHASSSRPEGVAPIDEEQ
jgi:hypothetical protein